MTPCLGSWVLMPELCHYTVGGPPEAGRYEITEVNGEVVFSVSWQASGRDMSVRFAAPPDGSPVPIDMPGVDSFSVSVRPDGALTSTAMVGEQSVAEAVRRVSADGQLLSVYQENADGKGGTLQSWQVYRREA